MRWSVDISGMPQQMPQKSAEQNPNHDCNDERLAETAMAWPISDYDHSARNLGLQYHRYRVMMRNVGHTVTLVSVSVVMVMMVVRGPVRWRSRRHAVQEGLSVGGHCLQDLERGK
jgi:hypothetical protein